MICTLSYKHSSGGYGPEKLKNDIPPGVLVTINKNDSWIMIVENGLEFEHNTANEQPFYCLTKSYGLFPRRTLPKGTTAVFIQDTIQE